MGDVKRLVLALTCTFSLGLTCGPPGPPPPDSCASPTAKAITEVELGPEMNEMRGFEAWASNDTGYITMGFQGGNMIGVSLRLSGDAPACLQQKTTVKLDGNVLAQETSPLNTYDATDGTRTTRTMWLVFDGSVPPIGTQVLVVTTAGGKTASSYVTIAEDRHRLDSLKVLTAFAQDGDYIDIELKSRHSPQYEGFTPVLSVTTPGVISLPPPTYVYDDTTKLTVTAIGQGETDLIAKLRDQEVRVHVVVSP
jgi:hypothetical protein